MRLTFLSQIAGVLVLGLSVSLAAAGQVRIAVAANFTAAMKEIAAGFESVSGHRTVVSFGSTGKLYAQIQNGAPFEVFLAADQHRPELLEQKDVASARFTYAIGKLVLWSSDAESVLNAQVLRDGEFKKFAIANPKTAPYGVGAVEVMRGLGVYEALRPKLVRGENIAQTYQFVATGNAQLGLVALAQVALNDKGSRWPVPETLYTPIRQDAVLLKRGKNNPVAQAFLDYLRSDTVRAIVHKYGYGTE